MASRLSERVNVYPSGVWVDASRFAQFVGVGLLVAADAAETVTAQLRKATDGSGANAANFRDAKVATSTGADQTIKAAADGRSDELGRTAGGLDFTHVQVQITDAASPENAVGFLIAGDARFHEDTLAGAGLASL